MSSVYGKSQLPIDYSGKVTLKVKSGKKVLKEISLHNNGGPALWKYFVDCLYGDYALAESARPAKIRLFWTGYSEGTAAPGTPITSADNSASSFISMTNEPTVGENSLTLHFVIPYSFITKGYVDQICLYGISETDVTNYSAYIFVTNAGQSTLAPLAINKAISNLSIILDWELIINNAN